MTFWDCKGSTFKGQNTHEEFFLDILTLDGEIAMLCWNITNQLPSHAVSYPKTIHTSHTKKLKLRGLGPHANYTDRAAATGRRS